MTIPFGQQDVSGATDTGVALIESYNYNEHQFK